VSKNKKGKGMTKQEPLITVSRRALLQKAVGAAGFVGLGFAIDHVFRTKPDVTGLRSKLPGLDLLIGEWEGKTTPANASIPTTQAELLAIRRRFADIEFTLLGGKPEAITVEQHELILRWLDALHIYATTRIASGVSPWMSNLYEGSQEFLNEHRAEWDGGLTEIVQQQQIEEQKKEEGD